jgi:hypothetical protein
MAPKLQEKNGRVRESGERFWYNGVTVKTSYQNEEKGLPFKGGKEERPLLDELQVSPSQERENKSTGAHFLGFGVS